MEPKDGCSPKLKGALVGWLIATSLICLAGIALLALERANSHSDMAGIGGAMLMMLSPLFGIIGAVIGFLSGNNGSNDGS